MTCEKEGYNDSESLWNVNKRRNNFNTMVILLCSLILIFFIIKLVYFYNVSLPSTTNVSMSLNKDRHRTTLYSYYLSNNSYAPLDNQLTKHEVNDKAPLDKVMSCYYNVPNNFSDLSELLPGAIHSHLCTHINVAFASIVNKSISLSENVKRTLKEIVQLRLTNPNIKILLSIGGSGEEDGFSAMVVDHASRKIFIQSLKTFLREYKIDGVDLDWEFPAVHKASLKLRKRERQHFSQLLREIRKEYERERRNYLLTVAAAAPQIIVDNAYDVDQLDLYTDYVNLMTYDFHFFTRTTPFTGLNSPLYPRKVDFGYIATLNINYTVNMYMAKGLSAEKIVVGVPTYGHSFTLVNPTNTQIGSPASGFGQLGSIGFVNYPLICKYMENYNNIIVETEADAKVPFLHKDKEWVSFENQASVMEKAKFVKDYGLRGAMIYSLNSDDYFGVCELHGNERFPLSQSVKNAFQ